MKWIDFDAFEPTVKSIGSRRFTYGQMSPRRVAKVPPKTKKNKNLKIHFGPIDRPKFWPNALKQFNITPPWAMPGRPHRSSELIGRAVI